MIRRRMRGRRSLWVHPINESLTAERKQVRKIHINSYCEFETTSVLIVQSLFPDLLNDPKKFYNYFRMSADLYFILQNMVADEAQKQSTNYRRAIPPEERLAIFLR
jgi:hypothetical protein